MKQVAKLLIIDENDRHLLLRRNNHPAFGDDPDLPGGTVENGESLVEALVREVQEEAGIAIAQDTVIEIYTGIDYSPHDTQYSLFVTRLAKRPTVVLSWEHASYAWLSHTDFLQATEEAQDAYMHMVYDALQ